MSGWFVGLVGGKPHLVVDHEVEGAAGFKACVGVGGWVGGCNIHTNRESSIHPPTHPL